MNKSPVAFVAAIIAAAVMLTASAEAGIKIRLGFGGPLPMFTAHGNGGGYSERHYTRKRYLARRAVKKEKVHVAKRKTSEPKVAKSAKSKAKPETVATAPVAEPDVITDAENSSITSSLVEPGKTAVVGPQTVTPVTTKAEVADAQQPAPPPVKAAGKLDCKKFFPSVGLTLTVPCE